MGIDKPRADQPVAIVLHRRLRVRLAQVVGAAHGLDLRAFNQHATVAVDMDRLLPRVRERIARKSERLAEEECLCFHAACLTAACRADNPIE